MASLVLGALLAMLRVELRWLAGRRFSGLPTVAAVLARGSSRLLTAVTRICVQTFRGLPVVITIFFVSAALPALGINNPLWYVVGGLTLYNTVVLAEILRSGMEGLPAGQREAAGALGLSSFQATRIILLPQAFRIMLPALISQVVVILKDTSLGFISSYEEVMNTAKQLIGVLSNPIQMYVVIGAIFVLVNYMLSKLARHTQRGLARARTSSRAPRQTVNPPEDTEPVAVAHV